MYPWIAEKYEIITIKKSNRGLNENNIQNTSNNIYM
jgi:hypothetical protein